MMGQQHAAALAPAPAGADHVDPFPRADWPRLSGGREATPDFGGAVGTALPTRRSPPGSASLRACAG